MCCFGTTTCFTLSYTSSAWTESLFKLLTTNNGLPIIKLVDDASFGLISQEDFFKVDFLIDAEAFICKHFIQFLSSIVIHELIYTHVTSTNTDNELPVCDLCINLLLPKLIVTISNSVDRNRTTICKNPISYHTINIISY